MVRISEIDIDGLHPQPPLFIQPRLVNLIYGLNEQGKTRLVEFLLRSLFHSSGKMAIRPVATTGRVQITGLDGKPDVWLNPRSKDKMEDYLAQNEVDLPPQLARLLVVKGAESELQAGYPGGLGRAVLKEYLTSQGVLDRIANRVPANTRQAQVQDGLVSGKLVGDLKRRKESLDQLDSINLAFREIESQLSEGRLSELTARLGEVSQRIELQKKARQHYINRLAFQLEDLEKQSDALPASEIADLEADIREEIMLTGDIKRLQDLYEIKQSTMEDYHWLNAALQTYHVVPGGFDDSQKWLPAIAAVGGLVGMIVFAFFELPWISAIFSILALGFGFWALNSSSQAARQDAANPQNRQIAMEFENRFKKRFSGIVDLQVAKNQMEREFGLVQNLLVEIQSKTEKKKVITARIDFQIEQMLTKHDFIEMNRQEVLRVVKNSRAEIDSAMKQVEISLKSYAIQPIPGGSMDEADEFNPQILAKYEQETVQLQAEIENLKQQKLSLKQNLCVLTHQPISIDLEQLILSLQDLRTEVELTIKSLTAEIVAGIAVTRAVEKLRSQESANLSNALQSPLIRETLKTTTGRYNQIDLIGEDLEVNDGFQTFMLSELSTGAQEQIMLGLRIGLASRLFSGKPLFLILDDAFQHSDWSRRPAMVDEVLRLAGDGWQIFYLTMDDHLRDLFRQKSPLVVGDEYLEIALGG
jgi:uncharacterized protein YhaN